jgi:peptidoglycan/xylan/chitin deacetylase (PgdA/CDA1 family)
MPARRSPAGQEEKKNVHYDYVPLPKRKPLKWPNGARLALIITTNLEFWDRTKDSDKPYYPGGPNLLPDPMPGNMYDNPNWSWREYGQRVGVWRMFDAFAGAGVPTSCTMNAKLGLERPEIAQAAIDNKWELVAHNVAQTDLLTNYQFDIEGERRLIREALKGYQQVVGKPARGWLSSSLRSNPTTPDLLAEEGLIFFTDIMNDDQPYLIKTKTGGPLVSIPYTSEINDFTLFMRMGMDVDRALSVLKEQFTELYREGESSGRIMNVGVHPHVIGQPFRIRALRDFIQYAKSFPGVWWATREEIAEWYLKNHSSHIG